MTETSPSPRNKDKAPTRPLEDRTRSRIATKFACVRATTERLLAPLRDEDYRIQSMDDVSPPYWTLGHTSWIFAASLLRPFHRMPDGYDHLDYSLNSYYEGLGPRLPRAQRGRVASPTTAEVRRYRRAIDAAVQRWIVECPSDSLEQTAKLILIGCEHEQQHQELFITEILHIRASDPQALRRPYLSHARPASTANGAAPCGPLRAIGFERQQTTIGYQGRSIQDGGFCWDNELPAHRAMVGDYALGDRLITNKEWRAFLDDGGYRDPMLWLANGWDFVKQEGLEAPLYWQRDGEGGYARFTHRGLQPIDPDAPVCHISFYEAEAFARWYGETHEGWRGARLPREVEWEHAARVNGFHQDDANLLHDDPTRCELDVDRAHPEERGLQQLAGTAWEWTVSHYEPYPGYRPHDGALSEYNGKFMDNQRVLRGGSFATPRPQARVAYRNFWPAQTRFQVSGLRLCVDR